MESTYQKCLAYELGQNGIRFQSEYPMPVIYKGIQMDCGYRIDLLVEDALILELKAVDEMTGIYTAQLLTYMKLAQIPEGMLINFNVTKLVSGVRSFTLRE